MNKLLDALQSKDVLTENGMSTHSTSGSYVLDMFFKMGGARALPTKDLINMVISAFGEDKLLTTKCVFYLRDVRQGQGERKAFRTAFYWLCMKYPEIAKKNLHLVPFYGRWDDLFVCFDTPVEKEATDLMLYSLKTGDKLCAKWMPRENKKYHELALRLMKEWELSPRQYRLLLSGNTEVVETLMCSGNWDKINYNHVPSRASFLYRKAFGKHDQDRYAQWLKDLEHPEVTGAKINAGAIYPSDIIKPYFEYASSSSDATIEAQWKALPDFVKPGVNFITVNDTSGSMSGDPIRICVALGIYLAERNKGPFKDAFITFSGRPALQILKGNSLREKVDQLHRANWDTNTDLEAVFKLILSKAVSNHVPQEDMPQNILIISDMQFDQAVRIGNNPTAMEMIRKQYDTAGYVMPNVIFWNVRTSTGVPAKMNEYGVALVSGYSPSIMKNILGGEISPMEMMLKVLNSERYSEVTI